MISQRSNLAFRLQIRLGILSLVLLLAISCLAPYGGAQSTGGRIRGTVMDSSGGAVAAVPVQLVNEATHATREVQSNENGEYIFIEVAVGTYEIAVNQPGFKKYLRRGIPVNLN
jgi:Carboxypeptidase regulatory-like domain